MDFGNHRYTNEQNCILFICKCDVEKHLRKNYFAPPPPSQNRSYGRVLRTLCE